ncbi:MAG: hypothetical protein AABW46_01560 [Nanoarchaeota archaeon]
MNFKKILKEPITRRGFFSVLGTFTILGCMPRGTEEDYYYYPNLGSTPGSTPRPIPTPSGTPISDPSSLEICAETIAEDRIRQIGYQGGHLNPGPDTYLEYLGNRVSYRCYNVTGKPYCSGRVLSITDMEEDLGINIKNDLIAKCSIGEVINVGVDIKQDETLVTIATRSSTISKSIELPLGRLYDVSHYIVNSEARTGEFDTLEYSLTQTQITGMPYIVQKLQPYPDKLYLCKIKDVPNPDNEFIFQFAIQGEPRSSDILN